MAELIHNPEIKALIHPTIMSNPQGANLFENQYMIDNGFETVNTSIGSIQIGDVLFHQRGGNLEIQELTFGIPNPTKPEREYGGINYVAVLHVHYLWYPNGAKLAEIYVIRTDESILQDDYDIRYTKAYIWNQNGTPLMDANFETNQFYKFNNDGSYTQLTLTYDQADELINREIKNLNSFAYDTFRENEDNGW